MHRKHVAPAILATTLLTTVPANATAVDLELLFINDVSGSINDTDYEAQIDGYAAAFRDSTVISKITDGAIGRIAVGVAFFATSIVQSVPWTEVSDAASGEAFAQLVESTSRPSVGSSDGLDTAISTAATFFNGNGFEGTRNVLDVVTEGADSGCGFDVFVCPDVQNARDSVLGAPLDQINALLLDDRSFFGNDPGDTIDAVAYAEENIIGGTGAFAVFAEDFTDFAPAVADKIKREIVPPTPVIPVPASVPLLISALGALGLVARRRR